jgi:hypothetical protein
MLFVSKRRKFRIVLKPSAHVLDAYGQKVIIPGITREFMNGRLYEEDPEIINMLLHNVHRPSQYDVALSKDEEQEWAAAHPDFGPAMMSTGSIGTANAPAAIASTQGPLREAAAKREQTPVVDLDKMLDEKITAKMTPLMDKIDKLLEMSAPAEKAVKPKKVFTCLVPGCGQVFRTGIDLGEHKRTAHVAPTE